MQLWMWFAIACSLAFLIGLMFRSIWNKVHIFVRYGLEGFKTKRVYPFTEARDAKLAAVLLALLAVSIASWFLAYYVSQQGLAPWYGDVATAVFGVATAGLLGGVVYEWFLRKQILAEASTTLAEIVTTDKSVASQLFSPAKRNRIIETMLQINTGNDEYGSALYTDFISRFTSETGVAGREFRFSFEDEVTFDQIGASGDSSLADRYYDVTDRITYRAELRSTEIFILGCAPTEDQLYTLFSDARCVYRWLLKVDESEFKAQATAGRAFKATLEVAGVACPVAKAELTSRGWEVHFKNPHAGVPQEGQYKAREGDLVEFCLESHTLHPRSEKALSVHLAYPVKGAQISFRYNTTDIQDVTRLHFLTGGKHTPKIEYGVAPTYSAPHREVSVKLRDDHWLFPDSGVVFIWGDKLARPDAVTNAVAPAPGNV